MENGCQRLFASKTGFIKQFIAINLDGALWSGIPSPNKRLGHSNDNKSDPARITDNFHCLGPAPVPSFLLDGKRPVMFEAGIYLFGPHYYDQLLRILGERRPAYLLLTHVHFDHCGAAGYLRRMIPDMHIGASREGSEIVKKPSAIELITKLNRFGNDAAPPFEPFTVDMVLNDGDEIEVSPGLVVQAIRTPGHTRDMTTYYIPALKAMIPSESIGVPGAGDWGTI